VSRSDGPDNDDLFVLYIGHFGVVVVFSCVVELPFELILICEGRDEGLVAV